MAFNGQDILFVAYQDGLNVVDYNSSGTQGTLGSDLGELGGGLAIQPEVVPEPNTFATLGVGVMLLAASSAFPGRKSKPAIRR